MIERMSESVGVSVVQPPGPRDRVEVLFDRLAELCGQRNAIDGRIVDIVAELDGAQLCGLTGARSVPALVAWKTGMSLRNARAVTAIAARADTFPMCVQGLREGWLSVDQVGAIATGAADGSDAHYVELAQTATVAQLRTAISLQPPPHPHPGPAPVPPRALVKDEHPDFTTYRITLPAVQAATFDAAVQSHHDALINDWKRRHPEGPDGAAADDPAAAPLPTTADAFLSLVEAGWDAQVAARPQGQRTTVVVHVDVAARIGVLHGGPLLCDADRRYLACDATCEVWFERDGQPLGVGRTTRTVNRRLRRALEHRDRCCVVPGCGATRGLHAHHLVHWEDGGRTDPSKLKYR
jgi:hypothetical protein